MRSKRLRRVVGATALGLLLVFIGLASVILLRGGYTPQYRSPDSIASLEQITLGGSPQWVLIRGANRNNPLLLFLHGGPGMPTMYLAHDFQRELEKDLRSRAMGSPRRGQVLCRRPVRTGIECFSGDRGYASIDQSITQSFSSEEGLSSRLFLRQLPRHSGGEACARGSARIRWDWSTGVLG
jgi:hypothetical protein